MMDASEVRRIANEHLDRMRTEMRLNWWHIDLRVARLEGDKAQCAYQFEYEHATITIDPDMAEGEDDVLRSLRHELLHLIHADFHLYARQVRRLLGEDVAESLDEAFDCASEKTVLRLERMLDLGIKHPLKPNEESRTTEFLREWSQKPYPDSDLNSYIESFRAGCAGLLKELEGK